MKVRSRSKRFLFAEFKNDNNFCAWVFLCEEHDDDIIFSLKKIKIFKILISLCIFSNCIFEILRNLFQILSIFANFDDFCNFYILNMFAFFQIWGNFSNFKHFCNFDQI
jgi:hypothetical protein